MTRTAILSHLANVGQWRTLPELAHATDADYPSEDYVAQDVQQHIRRGELIPRLRDEDTMTYEFGLPGWCYAAAPQAEPEITRVQRITRAQWGVPAKAVAA